MSEVNGLVRLNETVCVGGVYLLRVQTQVYICCACMQFRKTDTTAPKIPVVDVGIPMHLRSSGNNQQLGK